MSDCSWPFCNQTACAECAAHEAACMGRALTITLEALAEYRAALKASRDEGRNTG